MDQDKSKQNEINTLWHIKRVANLLMDFSQRLLARAKVHDDSKLESPEKEDFAEVPDLSKMTYGSEEYNQSLQKLKKALSHHYQNNSHHPEHYDNGVNGMDLLDLVEMLLDWKAASERHSDGDILKSIEINRDRFGLDDQTTDILRNTALRLFENDDPVRERAYRLRLNTIPSLDLRKNSIDNIRNVKEVIDKTSEGYYCVQCNKFLEDALMLSGDNPKVIWPHDKRQQRIQGEIWIVNEHYDGCRGWD